MWEEMEDEKGGFGDSEDDEWSMRSWTDYARFAAEATGDREEGSDIQLL